MEPELIKQLADYGPWGLAVVLIVLLRKEIASVLSASRDDRAVERLLADMNDQFARNMTMFERTNADLAAIRGFMSDLVTVNRQILTELVRK